MGAILGRFRKAKTTLEKLEELDKDIKCIEKYRYHTQQTEKKIVGQFILISTFVYILVVIAYYYMFFPTTFNEQIFYITPLLLVPILIWLIKRILKWYYKKKLNKNELKLSHLVQEKKRLIEQVMDTETYKVAKTILEKFAPENTLSSTTTTTPQFKLASTLRQRPIGAAKPTMVMRTSPTKPLGPPLPALSNSSTKPLVANEQKPLLSNLHQMPNTPMFPMPRVVLPKDRSVLDKMVEYLVGDGPNNRYALICKKCQGHNGMALREEFEYLSFRCCYCTTFNPSRKLRPSAPKLEDETIKRRLSLDLSSSESEKISDQSESESEKEPSKPTEASTSTTAPALDEQEQEKEIKNEKLDEIVDPTIISANDDAEKDKDTDKEKNLQEDKENE